MNYPHWDGNEFLVGCNYWASHAGTAMWRDWRPSVVDADFAALREQGMALARVFPLWPDFQPLKAMYGGQGVFVEYRLDENEPLPDTEAGQAGVDEAMLERFAYLVQTAERNGLKLIVAMITGWMSGRLFMPPALEGKNPLTDAEAIRWQVRFARLMVRRFKASPAIIGWGLGNECNVMAKAAGPAEAWNWTRAIADAIRLEDASRPVLSDMHSLNADERSGWSIADQAECVDLLTTHPYPPFTPHCARDRVNTFRNAFHAAAESRFYADIGGKPCCVEEAGNLGDCWSGPDTANAYLRNMLWNAWTHDCRHLLWWCAFDQDHLRHAPYDWSPLERTLGLMTHERAPKETIRTLGAFGKMTACVGPLPRYRREAVCILTEGQDSWAAAYSSFLLAKQAGFDLEFQWRRQPLRPADFYLLPSVTGGHNITGFRYRALLERVHAGATLLATSDDGDFQPFESVFGVRLDWREEMDRPWPLRFPDGTELPYAGRRRQHMTATTSETLAVDGDGAPVFSVNAYGRGRALFLSAGIEVYLAKRPGSFMEDAPPFRRFYRMAADLAGIRRPARSRDPQVTLTLHPRGENHFTLAAVNNTPQARVLDLDLAPGWSLEISGPIHLASNDGRLLELRRT